MPTGKKRRGIKTALEVTIVVVVAALLLAPTAAVAQRMGLTDCPGAMMSGPWGVFSGILGTAFVLAATVALIALAVYLVRRSRGFGGPRPV